MVNVLQPGHGLNLHVDAKAASKTISDAGAATEGVTDFILSLVPSSFVGAFTATDLWAAVAEARAPGSTPEPELGLGQLQ